MNLAYGLSGTITIGEATDKVAFDFEPGMIRAVQQVGSRSNFRTYIDALAQTINKLVNVARDASKQTLAAETSTTIFIGGFFGKSQGFGHMEFTHGIERTEATAYNHPRGLSLPLGSAEVFELLNSGDARFAKYSHPRRGGITSLAEGIERVRNDILAHYDAEAFKLDETIRWRIGGRVQIATVTLSNGFQWVPGYEAANALA
jgi:hypothetical protein